MYGIKKVAELTGMSPITLRAWEQRYGVIIPNRTEGGARVYQQEDLDDLLWVIHQKQAKKITVKQAMELLRKQKAKPLSETIDYRYFIDTIFDFLTSYDIRNATKLTNQLFTIHDAEAIFHHIFIPILVKVGDQWESKDLTVAHEHFISHFIEQQISQVFYGLESSGKHGKAIAICPPNEMHQIGLLLFSLFLKKRGVDVIFIGENTPIDAILTMLKKDSLDIVCLSVTLASNRNYLTALLSELEKEKQSPSIVIGGSGASKLPEQYQHFVLDGDLATWERWFEQHKQ
ncbi:methanogenic corrinoid protein MtbC1 [Natronobacillus azotifigens]|uniref:MerR family transcriptional regulator n=1 Tax=Natronobacillus azotifigens TaxID=472978 RepID=A0A9J6RBS3_9BACI|nr:MerR family transcriptional regulator [Natronobacillus azotifigens]MCZ0702779.1 MerR family transcriptional regulator [Natronobacillus azotifigens]